MKKFTPTDLRVKSKDVFNAVQDCKCVEINHRDRPRMLLMTESYLNGLLVSNAPNKNKNKEG